MSLLPVERDESCTPGYGGCTCECHRMPGVMHVMACCFPEGAELDEPDLARKPGEPFTESERWDL